MLRGKKGRFSVSASRSAWGGFAASSAGSVGFFIPKNPWGVEQSIHPSCSSFGFFLGKSGMSVDATVPPEPAPGAVFGMLCRASGMLQFPGQLSCLVLTKLCALSMDPGLVLGFIPAFFFCSLSLMILSRPPFRKRPNEGRKLRGRRVFLWQSHRVKPSQRRLFLQQVPSSFPSSFLAPIPDS